MGVRVIDQDVEPRGPETWFSYQFHPSFSAGVTYRPEVDKANVLANWRVLRERERRPAIVLGTNTAISDAASNQIVFATLSKGLGARTSIYVGAAWFTGRHDLRALGGLQVDLSRRVALVLQHDGLNVHPALRVELGRHAVSLLAVEGEQPGVAWSVRF